MMKGKLVQNSVHLKEHEYKTVKFLLDSGYDVELIPPSRIQGLRVPDIILNGVAWEMKSPQGNGRKTIKNTVQNASHQSDSIIIDLRRMTLSESQTIKELEKQFRLSRRLRRMKVIVKAGEILDYAK